MAYKRKVNLVPFQKLDDDFISVCFYLTMMKLLGTRMEMESPQPLIDMLDSHHFKHNIK